MTYSAQQAIAESIQKNAIVTLMADLDLKSDLLAASEGDVRSGDTHEFWGVTEDGDEWRVHLDFTGMVAIEIMPEYLRDRHRAAGNWGRYPLNGAERMLVTEEEAAELIEDDDDEYNHLV